MRSIWRAEIDGDLFGASAGLADFCDDRRRRLLAGAVVDENLCAGLRQRECASATDAA